VSGMYVCMYCIVKKHFIISIVSVRSPDRSLDFTIKVNYINIRSKNLDLNLLLSLSFVCQKKGTATVLQLNTTCTFWNKGV
jgi:hypothetical protein